MDPTSMRMPESLVVLVDYGIIQEVVRPLMSGKEAQVFVVIAGGQECVAKVYKEANQRTFKHRVEYTEGRRTRNTRDQRAIKKRTRHGRKQDEAAWRNAEVDTIYRLGGGGVRVPEPINFVDGVLVMELVKDADGNPAPRLGDLEFSANEAYQIYRKLIREVVRMLCAGVIHGDLSEFNVLMAADGPVVIDFPQSVDPAKNQSARKLLLRDVENLHRFLTRHSPRRAIKPLAEEMWTLYETNRLEPDTELLGNYVAPVGDTNMDEVLALIEDANQDEQMRRDARGDETPLVAQQPMRRVVDFTKESKPRPRAGKPRDKERPAGPERSLRRPPKGPAASRPSSADSAGTPSKRRSRRRRTSSTGSERTTKASAPRGESPRSTRPPNSEKPREKAPSGAGERDQSQRRRRRRRGTPRTGADEKKTGPKAGPGPAPKPAASAPSRGGNKSTSSGAGAGSSRRRRRRPRNPNSNST